MSNQGNRRTSRFEKPKDFKTAMKKLALSLKSFWPGIVISFILAVVASILAINAPNKLANLTDELQKGIIPNKKVMEDITGQITSNLTEDNITSLVSEVINPSVILKNASKLKLEDSEEQELVENFIKEANPDNFIISLSSLPDKIKIALLNSEDSKYTPEEKLALINALATNNYAIDAIPVSILTNLFPEFTYQGVTISSAEQINFIKMFKDINGASQEEIYAHIDALPKEIYDLIKPSVDMPKVEKWVVVIALLYGLNAIFTYILSLIVVHVVIKYSKLMRSKISTKINKLPLKFFDRTTIGDTLSRITNDVDTIGQSLHQSLSTLVSSIALFIGSIFMMFKTNATMAITAILASVIGFAFMSVILRKSQKYFIARQTEIGNINGHIEEIFSGHNVVTLYNGKEVADKKFDELNERVYVCEQKSHFLSGLMHPFMAFVGNFGYVAVCIVGAILTMRGNISFGVIVAFMIYVRQFTNPLSQIAQSMTSLQSASAAGERVFEFLEQEEMQDESAKQKYLKPSEVKGEITFEHVKFGYDSDKLIIKDFNAQIKPGQKIAIVGPTGAGKTTLVNLLMRFYEINDGVIKIDGVSTKELTRDNIHQLFIMVLQDTWLFNGTIKDNIRYNKENVTDEEIMAACKVVGIDHFIRTLPFGLNSEITDAGSISAGQKQLLTIARGMIENAPFLILDEATSNVDTRTEELVQQAMDKLTLNRTSFIIAHRLSTIKNADLILVMNEGNIIEQGNHEELMQKNGFYANLYNSQFENVSK